VLQQNRSFRFINNRCIAFHASVFALFALGLEFFGIAPVRAQTALQQEQAKAMRANLPPEAECSYNGDGRPICEMQFGSSHPYLSMLHVMGYSPGYFLATVNATFFVSDAQDENVRSIVIKYLNTFGIDGTACVNGAMSDARDKGTGSEGIAHIANDNYRVQCKYSRGKEAITYLAFVSANSSF
jgi:hypothetical protein